MAFLFSGLNRSPMLLQDFSPSFPLRAYVKCYRIVHFEFDPGYQVPVKAYPPKPEQTLHFYCQGELRIAVGNGEALIAPPMLFIGQQQRTIFFQPTPRVVDVQVVFKPGAFSRLTGIPSVVVADTYVDATQVFPPYIRSTLSALQETTDYAAMINIVESFVLQMLRNSNRPGGMEKACELMEKKHGNVPVDWLASQACYSDKQFKRKFLNMTGVNPKTYARILRMNYAYNIRNCFPSRTWQSIAAHCGYSDYQHLARDYKEFTLFSPAGFHHLESTSPEQVLGLSKALYRQRFNDA